jgi:hypothetical protein
LGGAVFFQIAPRGDRFLVAPERQRQDLAGVRQAFEALDGDEAVDVIERRTKMRRDGKVVRTAAGVRRFDFEK